MRKILVLAALCMTAMMSAQTPSEKYEQRYNMLSSQFGAAGVGVETVLDNWEKIKNKEKERKTPYEQLKSVAVSLPSLMRCQKLL